MEALDGNAIGGLLLGRLRWRGDRRDRHLQELQHEPSSPSGSSFLVAPAWSSAVERAEAC